MRRGPGAPTPFRKCRNVNVVCPTPGHAGKAKSARENQEAGGDLPMKPILGALVDRTKSDLDHADRFCSHLSCSSAAATTPLGPDIDGRPANAESSDSRTACQALRFHGGRFVPCTRRRDEYHRLPAIVESGNRAECASSGQFAHGDMHNTPPKTSERDTAR
jgi:hypothetical protein